MSILQEGGHFSGINRKAQLKPLAWERVPEASRERASAEGKEPPSERVTEALLILKFGGVLTHLGKNQAEFLGRDFRMRMYPGGNYYDEGNTDGLLRLHSTYRHDLKIYSSDEGRVQITAAAFAKGLLDLETSNNQLTPILASLVNKDAKLLDFVTHEVEEDILHAKQKLYNIMTEGHVKGRGPNKEYSTSDTAVFDDDFERSGPVGYLRRTSANAKALRVPSPKKAPHPGGPSVPQPGAADESARGGEAPKKPKGGSGSYALMSADRARALKTARKSLSKAASSAMYSLREAMLSAMASGVVDEKVQRRAAASAPSPRKMKSADDLTELNREPDARGDSQLPPSGEASTAASPSRASIDEMAAVVGRVDADDADFAPLPAPAAGLSIPATHPNAGADEEQEYRLSLERDRGGVPPAHLARGSWNAGEVKRSLETRLALGLSETAETARPFARAAADVAERERRSRRGRCRRRLRVDEPAHVPGRGRRDAGLRDGRTQSLGGGVDHAAPAGRAPGAAQAASRDGGPHRRRDASAARGDLQALAQRTGVHPGRGLAHDLGGHPRRLGAARLHARGRSGRAEARLRAGGGRVLPADARALEEAGAGHLPPAQGPLRHLEGSRRLRQR